MLKVAIVGCGYWGVNYVRVFSDLAGCRVAVACDSSEARLAAVLERHPSVAMTSRLDDVLRDNGVDAVIVATPAATHHEVAAACLNAGKHVLIEKPMTATSADAESLVAVAQRSGRVLLVGHTFLYNAGVGKLKALMAGEDFGRIYYLHATRTNMGPIRRDVNAVWDLAAHDVSIFNYLLDASPTWVSAVGAKVLGNEREDVAFVTLGYPNGVLANIHTSWVDPNKVREVVVVSSRKRIVFDDLNNLERVRIFEKGVSTQHSPESFGEFRLMIRDGDILSPRVEPSEPLKNLAEHFVECVRNGTEPRTSAADGLRVVRVLEAIDAALRSQGAAVAVA